MLRTLSLRHVPTVLQRTLRTASLTAVLAVAASLAEAQTVYVDGPNPLALDTNIGTEAQPFKTIAGALVLNKGANVTILVKPGVYREAISVPSSGAAGLPFVFRATGPGVVLDGSDDFSTSSQWAAAAGGEFLAAGVTWNPATVWVNGQRLTASSAAVGSLPANTFRYVAGTGLYVDIGGTNPGLQATFVTRRLVFTMSNRQYVTIDGFEIVRSNDRGVNMFGSSEIIIRNNKIDRSNSYGIQGVGCTNVTVEGNAVSRSGNHGIGLLNGTPGPSSGWTVRNNESFENVFPTTRQANGIFLAGSPNNTISGNKLHHNQDTGLHFSALSDNCISFNNISYANGDHGFDHLGTSNVVHMHDVAFGNFIDGFSFEGNSPGGKVFNCVSVDNGLTQSGNDLWVDLNSSVGFASNHNLFWNSTAVTPIRFIATTYLSVADFALANPTLDQQSRGADPMFTNAAAGNFMPLAGSPLVDAAKSDIPNWPALDMVGQARMDVTLVPDAGIGPVTFADMGALEFIPPADRAPVVVGTPRIIAIQGSTITFTVTASDPDGDPINSLTMRARLKKNASQPILVVNPTNTSATVTWAVGNQNGTSSFTFTASNALTGTGVVEVQAKRAVRAPGPNALESGEYDYELISLSGGFPMPTSGAVEFALMLPSDDQVDFNIYDTQGRRVFSESRMANAGHVRLRWSGVDMSGRRAATGIYFAQVRVGENVFTRRIVRN